jgi:hypothetical protein
MAVYTLAAIRATFAVTRPPVAFLKGTRRTMVHLPQALAVTGYPAKTIKGKNLLASPVSVTVTCAPVSVVVRRVLKALPWPYTAVRSPAALLKGKHYRFIADAKQLTVSGPGALLNKRNMYKMFTHPGSFLHTGEGVSYTMGLSPVDYFLHRVPPLPSVGGSTRPITNPGFSAVNGSNEVLVSGLTDTLHFLTKANNAYNGPINVSNMYGGRRTYEFNFWMVDGFMPVPFFSMPVTGFYGITRMWQAQRYPAQTINGYAYPARSLWAVELVVGGVSSSQNFNPEVYIFAPAGAFKVWYGSSEQYGMQVFKDDGSIAFDSRLKPLMVLDTVSLTHPSTPVSSIGGVEAKYCNSANSASVFAPDRYNVAGTMAPAVTKAIYSYHSMPQAEQRKSNSASHQECTGFEYGGCVGYATTDQWSSTYWCFFRGGVKRAAVNSIHAGWVPYSWGCKQTHNSSDSFIGFELGSGSYSNGLWPYSNETINLSEGNVIIANGAAYD